MLIREGELIKKFSSKGGRSFEKGALLRVGVHSNKYGNTLQLVTSLEPHNVSFKINIL